MTNWAPDYTPRVIWHYTSGGLPHTWTMRGTRGTPAATMVSQAALAADGLIGALAPLLPDDFIITQGEYIAEDTTIGIPISPVPSTGTGDVPVANLSTADKASFLRFPAKSNLGLRHSITVFGVALNMDTTLGGGQSFGRITTAENADVASAVLALQSNDLVANDNMPVTWYQYCTCKVNDYWWKQARKTGGL